MSGNQKFILGLGGLFLGGFLGWLGYSLANKALDQKRDITLECSNGKASGKFCCTTPVMC